MDEKNQPLDREQIPALVTAETAADRLIIDDWHTHLLGPKAGPELSLHGIDQQLTYHYVRRKLFAAGHIDPETFNSWNLQQQGDFTWQKLFAEPSSDPFDEGCRGVIVAMEHDLSRQEGAILHHSVLPVLKDLKLPFFMMPGPIRQLKPTWRDAGDGVGFADILPYQHLLRRHPENAFFITPLHNANQYDASVLTCHNDNCMVIGHWWFNYHPGLVEQDLRMRLEMTGDRFIPFNSDARVLENLIPKWSRFRTILAKVMSEKYQDLHDAGRRISRAGIVQTLQTLFDPNRFSQLN